MSKIIKNKRNICMIIIFIILFIVILTLSYFLWDAKQPLSNEELVISEYDNILKNYDSEKVKYDKMLKYDSINDIYDYFIGDIDSSVYYPIPVMDYVFEQLFPKATFDEKFELYYMYYKNLVGLEEEYKTYLNDNTNLMYFAEIIDDGDFENLDYIATIDKPVIRSILLNMKANNLVILNNQYNEIIVHYNHQVFIDKYRDILDEDYIAFEDIERQADEMILNPGGNTYNVIGSIWYIHTYEEFIKNTSNYKLKMAAQDVYEQNLAIFFAQYDDGFFYQDNESFEVSENFITAYNTYVSLYPDDNTSTLISDVLDYINENQGQGIDILDGINQYIYNFIDVADWLPNEASTDTIQSDVSNITIEQ